ncbi:Fumarylacetoacetase [hydrothermal vent metagenome]|uniref:fumarylacetoacetase n=1 Tax=hydrothermal vent metagenome TaxID=652676 RepID=A0A3B0RH65_9ZZZZ
MKSWIASANVPDTHFPLQNLPYGVACVGNGKTVCVSVIGDLVVNLAALESAGLIVARQGNAVFDNPCLNEFMSLGKNVWQQVREDLAGLLAQGGNAVLENNAKLRQQVLEPMADVAMLLPFEVAEYTDFYAGMHHAKNMGAILRGSDELPANWLHIPIGYNGRASSVVVSGRDIPRPLGQRKPTGADVPEFGPTQRLDFELELGAVVGTGNRLGQPVTMAEAEDMIFGYVLLNDWSARDIQSWEYQPLGPFQGKAFATTISPWVVTTMALEEFRCPVPARIKEQLPYLKESIPGLFDISLEVSLQPAEADRATVISQTNYHHMYYSSAQQLCHHAISGCKMNTGDLLGSGTVSGPLPGELGSMMELGQAGREPLGLDTGQTRSFIEDGDTITLSGWAQGDGYKIGFGECTGKIIPAVEFETQENV